MHLHGLLLRQHLGHDLVVPPLHLPVAAAAQAGDADEDGAEDQGEQEDGRARIEVHEAAEHLAPKILALFFSTLESALRQVRIEAAQVLLHASLHFAV